MSEMWRLFIALELPPPILQSVSRVQNDLKRKIPERAAKWVRPDGIHLTLKFLGDVPTNQMDAIRTSLADAVEGHAPFFIGIQGLGCFPHTRQPRVLWLGLVGEVQKLAALQQSVEQQIAPLGYPTEERGFHPHLTLARANRDAPRQDLAALGRAAEDGLGQLGSWQVANVSLMRSQLRPTGAVYTQVWDISLEPSGG